MDEPRAKSGLAEQTAITIFGSSGNLLPPA